MGYRSDVALVVNKDIYVEAMKEALKNPAEPQYHMLVDSKGEVVVNEIRVEGNYAVLYWEYVKWDDSYEDVKFIENMRNNNNSYFIRIGESYEDVEVELNGNDGDMYSCIDLHRSIDICI